jgi:cytochrome c5
VRLLAIAILSFACAEPTPAREEAPAITPSVRGDPARGRELLATFECNRCHDGTGLEDAPRDRQCVGCHRAILDGSFDAPADRLAEWREALHSLDVAPSLARLPLRVDWIEQFLLRPSDVRPGLEATMPRLPISEQQAADLAAALGRAPEQGRANPADIERGTALLRSEGCTACHAFGDLAAAPAPSSDAIRLAPDLRFTRDRMDRSAITEWLRDPGRMRPGTLMPRPNLSEGEIETLADLIASATIAPPVPPRVPARLPILARAVRYEEVAERVLRQSCWHCHADPDFARGDGGAGNTGGFGYPGRRVDLHDYAGVSSGYLTTEGERRSLFALDGATPHLITTLMARHHEVAGEPVEGVTGMPLGLPPLPLEDIQLVETWIAQGRPL